MPFGFHRAAHGLISGDWRAWLRRCAEQEVEQRRLFPWTAVAFGCGILLFFAADGRPALWAPIAAASLSAFAAFLARRRLAGFAAAVAFTALFLGFAAGVIRMRSIEAPVLGRITISPLAGFVESVEERAQGARLIVGRMILRQFRPRRARAAFA